MLYKKIEQTSKNNVKWMLVTIRPGWNSSFLSAGRFLNKDLYIFWPMAKKYKNMWLLIDFLKHLIITFGSQTSTEIQIWSMV